MYRWLPEALFNPTPIYVYGDKLAMIVWGSGRNDGISAKEIIVIKNLSLADAYRKQFLFMWEQAEVPPTEKVSIDERQRLETAIMKRFGGRVSAITDNDRKVFREFLHQEKDKTYSNSWYYLCQAANGIGRQKLGLKYLDGSILAPIGIYNWQVPLILDT